ncbi:BCCT family transporter [Corticimicrobacter populi]|uniref:BCCT family transporter n=1 Tax=Corticimicrobacter populi TaxID=2175229 RepID=UPI001956FCE0|nr:BCCT family transporter [Corticimicrobacter populi]
MRKRLDIAVFLPTSLIILSAAVLGLVDNEMLVRIAKGIFYFALSDFAWLYQLAAFAALVLTGYIFFSKAGNIRLGGPDAKPVFSLASTFAMALSGGIATGVVTYSVNEPIIYLGNVYGEIANQDFSPVSNEAAIFAIARSFHNWSFIPYAIYSVVGLMIAYTHFNARRDFSIAATLAPVLGSIQEKPAVRSGISIMAVLAIALGLASSFGAGLALIGSGLESQYGIVSTPSSWLVLTLVTACVFLVSALFGLRRGMKFMSHVNAFVFYAFLVILLVVGPVSYIFSLSTTALGYWLDNFFLWSFDTGFHGGEALVSWWTMYDWSIWIAYAPLMGLFLARISYGRTLREFLLINWIAPSIFGMVWFSIWGASAIQWQMDGTLDLVKIVTEGGAVAGLWSFLQHLPFAWILVPLAILTLVVSFATAADAMTSTIAATCVKRITAEEEAPKVQKVFWGILISVIAYVMVAFGGGAQGVDGIKFLAAAGGFCVLFLFILIVVSAIRLFVGRGMLPGQDEVVAGSKEKM